VIREHGGRPAPALVYNFPGVNLISVNDEVVHGIPGERTLQEGDLVKLDVTVEKDGFMADAAVTVGWGRFRRRKGGWCFARREHLPRRCWWHALVRE